MPQTKPNQHHSAIICRREYIFGRLVWIKEDFGGCMEMGPYDGYVKINCDLLNNVKILEMVNARGHSSIKVALSMI